MPATPARYGLEAVLSLQQLTALVPLGSSSILGHAHSSATNGLALPDVKVMTADSWTFLSLRRSAFQRMGGMCCLATGLGSATSGTGRYPCRQSPLTGLPR